MSAKSLILLVISLHLFCDNRYLSQNKILISDTYFVEDSANLVNKSIQIQKFSINENSFLFRRLNSLTSDCKANSTLQNSKGFLIYFPQKIAEPLQIIVSSIEEVEILNSPKINGVFQINDTPFFILNLPEQNELFNKTDQLIALQLIVNTNELSGIILNNNHNENQITVEKFKENGVTYELFIESCQLANQKWRLNVKRN